MVKKATPILSRESLLLIRATSRLRSQLYSCKKHGTVHVPIENEIGSARGQVVLRRYAMRAKLLVAFQRFTYEFAELQWVEEGNPVRFRPEVALRAD